VGGLAVAPLEIELDPSARGLKALEGFLSKQLDYDLYSEHFADDLAEILQDNLPEDQAEDAQTLACECARNEPGAVDKVNEVLAGISLHMTAS
jgi:hypothetical protein